MELKYLEEKKACKGLNDQLKEKEESYKGKLLKINKELELIQKKKQKKGEQTYQYILSIQSQIEIL